jgi:universal stress protein A
MAAYVQRAATLFGARVSLIHVIDPSSINGLETLDRSPFQVQDEHLESGRKRLNSFCLPEFPLETVPRILAVGDPATEIVQAARHGNFDLIIMPTHAGIFRRMLLGSTTAKVLDSAHCPVLTSMHSEVIAPRPLQHRVWVCAVGLGAQSERVLRYAKAAVDEVPSKLAIVHAVQSGGRDMQVRLDLEERIEFAGRQEARKRIAELQRAVGLDVPVHLAVGPVKDALLEAARQSDADALIIGRNHGSGAKGLLRDLTYAVVRDSPFPVLSV